jgi:hypothetical protein
MHTTTMEQKLAKRVRILQIYLGFLTLALTVMVFLFFQQSHGKEHFKEIDVERINVVESNGALRMVISNQKRQHPGAMGGKMLVARERSAGMIFFNDEGDECGGLIYDGSQKQSSMVYSVDQYKNDQIMQLQYSQDSSSGKPVRSYGLKMWDRSDELPLGSLIRLNDSLQNLHNTSIQKDYLQKLQSEGLLGIQRLFLGKTPAGEVGLFIKDDKGRLRLNIGLGSTNNIILQMLDTNGHELPFHH